MDGPTRPAPPIDPRPANLPTRLRLIDVVGRGATSTVWRARDRRGGRDVAVKVLADGPLDRFEAEARTLARLADRDDVLRVLAVGHDGSCAWIVTELATTSLAGRLRDDGPLPTEHALSLGADLATALAAVHAAGVVHGDVTPANVLFVDRRTVLSDFGTATVDGARPSDSTGPVDTTDGSAPPLTPGWAAPELLHDDGRLPGHGVAPPADVYGLGATLWTACTGERPPTARPPDPGDLPRGLAGIVAACCDPDPARRPSAAATAAQLRAEARRRARYCPGP